MIIILRAQAIDECASQYNAVSVHTSHFNAVSYFFCLFLLQELTVVVAGELVDAVFVYLQEKAMSFLSSPTLW
jgi:hypothetical protein